jgi:hypothetical protein
MPRRKPASATPTPAVADLPPALLDFIQDPRRPRDLHSAVLDFIRRGQRAQAAVDETIAAENERLSAKRPKGRA